MDEHEALREYFAFAVQDAARFDRQVKTRTWTSEDGQPGDYFGRDRTTTADEPVIWPAAVNLTTAPSLRYGAVREGHMGGTIVLSATLLELTVEELVAKVTELKGQLAGSGATERFELLVGSGYDWQSVVGVRDVQVDRVAGLVTLNVETAAPAG